MKAQPIEEKPKEPECTKCYSKGIDIGLLKGLCRICFREKYPDLFEMTEADEAMLARFKRGEFRPIPQTDFDPQKDKAKDAFQPDIEDAPF